jgi:hypothetical protein
MYENVPSAGPCDILPASVYVPLHIEQSAALGTQRTIVLNNETTSVLAPGLSIVLSVSTSP